MTLVGASTGAVALQVAPDGKQTRSNVLAHPSDTVGGPSDPTEEIADVLRAGLDVPQPVDP